jgi:hypothetical protein
MTSFISNIIWNSVEGFVDAGKKTAGEYGGNALIKAGDIIENSGRSVGNGIEKKAVSYGTALTGQTYKPTAKALPSTARKPAVKRSNSTPASNKPTTSGTPLGAKKYPGSNQVNGAVGGVNKAVGGVNKTVGGLNNAVGGVTGGASKVTGGVVGRANSTAGNVTNNATRATGSLVGGGQKAISGATRSIPPFKGPGATPSPNKALPKAFPDTNSMPKPAYPTSKKAAVKPGQPKPFTPPVEQKKPDPKKPYPGTNTLPGTSRTPVQQHKLKPLPKMGPQVTQGQTMKHIAI